MKTKLEKLRIAKVTTALALTLMISPPWTQAKESTSNRSDGDGVKQIKKKVYFLSGAEPGLFGTLGNYHELAGSAFVGVKGVDGKKILLPIIVKDFTLDEDGKTLGFGRIDASSTDKFIFWSKRGCGLNAAPLGIHVEGRESPETQKILFNFKNGTPGTPGVRGMNKWTLLRATSKIMQTGSESFFSYNSAAGGCRDISGIFRLQKLETVLRFLLPPSFDSSRMDKLFVTTEPSKKTINSVIKHLQTAKVVQSP